MAESRHEQISLGIVSMLAGIVGDDGVNYWHTPSAVARVTQWSEEFLDSTMDYLIMLGPGEERHFEDSGKKIRAEAEFYLLIAKQHRAVTQRPWIETAPTRYTVINRCQRDVLKKLWGWTSDPVLGSGLEIENIAADAIVADRVEEFAGWALQFLRFTVVYHYFKSQP